MIGRLIATMLSFNPGDVQKKTISDDH